LLLLLHPVLFLPLLVQLVCHPTGCAARHVVTSITCGLLASLCRLRCKWREQLPRPNMPSSWILLFLLLLLLLLLLLVMAGVWRRAGITSIT
jgi:hypothetical protein